MPVPDKSWRPHFRTFLSTAWLERSFSYIRVGHISELRGDDDKKGRESRQDECFGYIAPCEIETKNNRAQSALKLRRRERRWVLKTVA